MQYFQHIVGAQTATHYLFEVLSAMGVIKVSLAIDDPTAYGGEG